MLKRVNKIAGIIGAVCISAVLCSCTDSGKTEIETANWNTARNLDSGSRVPDETKPSEETEPEKETENPDTDDTYYSSESVNFETLETCETVTFEKIETSESSKAETSENNEPVFYEKPSESTVHDSAESPVPAAAEPSNIEADFTDLPSFEEIPKTWDFTDDMVFAGDSICRGFGANKIVDSSRVMARGNVATWSFFDYEMYREGSGLDFSTALKQSDPKYVLLLMGMNDVNMIESDQFCENYKNIIDTALDSCEADIFVCAITPVNSRFASNERISSYNNSLKEMIGNNYPEKVHFIDFAKYLKDSSGNLRNDCDSGDGVHLSYYSYYIALWELSKTLTD